MDTRTADSVVQRSLSGVKQLYTDNIKQYGTSSKSVGWPDQESQRLRFSKLTTILDSFPGEEIEVNDWGCGYGAMFKYLDESAGQHLAKFNGYDISAEMLEEAKQFVSDERGHFFLQGDLATEADISFVSGTFNVKMDASDEEWRSYVEERLCHIAEFSRYGFAFNLLTSHVDWKQPDLFYADPTHFFDFCVRNFSRNVTLLHDYPLFEWTIVVLKDSL